MSSLPPPPQPPPRPPPPPYPPFPPPGVPPTTTNGFAVAALVLGIVGGCTCVGWVLALVFGYLGKSQIDGSGGLETGRGLAVAGIVLGYVWGALTITYFIVQVIVAAAS